MSLIPLPESLVPFLEPYLPTPKIQHQKRPFVTLTYAQSLDSRIAAKKGTQTKISHLETKTMTHYLRSKHDAIMVAIGTVQADDPKLNCRYREDGNDHSPRPVILDPHGKWNYSESQLRAICDNKQGKAPYIIIEENVKPKQEDIEILQEQNGLFIYLPLSTDHSANWDLILQKLHDLGVESIMIEGGAMVINELLDFHRTQHDLIDSLIITVGPIFLGSQGVEVSPRKQVNLEDVKWWTGVSDSIICAKVTK
ncbi:hypothetical protein G9P44_001775 [Scheffersomyces stipitis]|nr:hypothetical protein G9P44_001775 [Scheffersomyces stipitis]